MLVPSHACCHTIFLFLGAVSLYMYSTDFTLQCYVIKNDYSGTAGIILHKSYNGMVWYGMYFISQW